MKLLSLLPRSEYVLALQIVCLTGLIIDTYLDNWGSPTKEIVGHIAVEFVSVSVLIFLAILETLRNRKALALKSAMISDLQHRQPSVATSMEECIASWQLTEAEAEIALLIFKGCETSDISKLRKVSTGTTKAQLSSIYRKAGVSGKSGLLSAVLDRLVDRELATTSPTETSR